ncbi:Cyclin-like protein [Artemisia annua]|uniref:Cyclin-like protein n=1 Tax=Artemisia annua TaxID=35608 RepID=A0A2U1P7S2_ARTAN|nr:Cyclin-like protein [Artemisia annua]
MNETQNICVKIDRMWKEHVIGKPIGLENLEFILIDKDTGYALVLASIVSFDSDKSWFYMSCYDCHVKVTNRNDVVGVAPNPPDFISINNDLWCKICKIDPQFVVPRYGFITSFSTWSLEPYPVFAQTSVSYSGHLAELERVLETTSSSSASGPSVVVDNLRAYLQIIDVADILGLDCDISDHAFQLFRDCSSATCLRNRSVEALATAALVQAIREAQEPRTLQEISIAANLPQKEIGKYIKILGEALQLSQPLNSNSISVHMPRFCTLLQLNKSAQELATHIGEVVINKCFCTRRNPISISAAAIYLASQLEDKRKTQAEICKVTGLTEVTLRKVYKELLENWDDLLPSNYTPAIPPEKAFPTATIASGRSTTPRINDGLEADIKPLESRDNSNEPWKFQSSQDMDVDGGGSNGGATTRPWPPPISSSQANARAMPKPDVLSGIGDLNRHGNDNRG